MENDDVPSNSDTIKEIPKPSRSRPSFKAKTKTKIQKTSKIAYSKQELQVISKTLLKLLSTKEESINGTESKPKEDDDDELEDDMENPARFLRFSFRHLLNIKAFDSEI